MFGQETEEQKSIEKSQNIEELVLLTPKTPKSGSEFLFEAQNEPVAPLEMKQEQTTEKKSKGSFQKLVINFLYAQGIPKNESPIASQRKCDL